MKKNIHKDEFNFGDFILEGWRVYRTNFLSILIIAFIFYFPYGLFIGLLKAGMIIKGETLTLLKYEIIIGMSVGLIFLIPAIAIMYLALATIENKQGDLKTALTLGITRWPLLFATSLLAAIFIIPLFILLIVPGIIFSIYWVFIAYAVLVHKKLGLAAMRESKALVKGRWWVTWGRVIGASLMVGIAMSIVGTLLGFITNLVEIPGATVLVEIISVMAAMIFGSYITCYLSAMYVNYSKVPAKNKK